MPGQAYKDSRIILEANAFALAGTTHAQQEIDAVFVL